MTKQEFGRLIRAIREKRGIKQAHVASMLGLTDSSYLSHVERGIAYCSNERAMQLAQVLDIEPLLIMEALASVAASEVRIALHSQNVKNE